MRLSAELNKFILEYIDPLVFAIMYLAISLGKISFGLLFIASWWAGSKLAKNKKTHKDNEPVSLFFFLLMLAIYAAVWFLFNWSAGSSSLIWFFIGASAWCMEYIAKKKLLDPRA